MLQSQTFFYFDDILQGSTSLESGRFGKFLCIDSCKSFVIVSFAQIETFCFKESFLYIFLYKRAQIWLIICNRQVLSP